MGGIIFYEDDPRKVLPEFSKNCGSFSKIGININLSLAKLGLLAKNEEDADWVGFSTGTNLDFGFRDKRRFLVGVWESQILPNFLVNLRQKLESQGNYKYFGLSQQVTNAWDGIKYPVKTPIVNIGVDTEFWKRQKPKQKNAKFTILSVTSCNFRSGIDQTIQAFYQLSQITEVPIKLIIKNTDERAEKLPSIIQYYRKKFNLDIEYLFGRYNDYQIRDLYELADLLLYIPLITSGGLPITEAASMELPCIVPDYCPTNIYPSSEKVQVSVASIAEYKHYFTQTWSLPYTFPEGCIDETKAEIYLILAKNLANTINKVIINNDYYLNKASKNRKLTEKQWTWDNSAQELIKNLE